MPERLALRCAPAALARAEPLTGTASRVQRWVIVEQPGAWGSDALRQSGLDTGVAERLAAEARRHGVRVLLGRRPGQRRLGADRTVHLVHAAREARWIEQVELPADEPAALLDLDLGALALPEPPGVGRPGPPLHLVCTNGRHDPCCADFGRPVVRALAAAGAPDVWEVSHVGGDRFAANLVCLPEGVYYGRVTPERAPGLVADLRAGFIDLAHYRGRSFLPPVVQAADAFAREHLGERRVDGLALLSTERLDEGVVAVLVQQRDGDALRVVVRAERAPAVQLTCLVHEERRPWAYRLVELGPPR
ncbi:MAG: sucrase ferredoxin [Acidimicrobiia bacterium]